ncbi:MULTISPECIES: response regulator [Mumia]|uniref:response regulator n=1 Tax=Mumia TaxID=1546255 RepID=UPI001423A4C1|nr:MULTISPECIES: response regulator transcription factor [unclassified Mumia]
MSTSSGGPADRPLRVFLVDDQQLVRAGFRMLVESQPDMEVVGEAADGLDAVERLSVTGADVVLMDVRMPRMDGVAATRALTERGVTARVVVLTTFDLDEYVYAGLRAGASAFLLKDAPPEVLLSAIRDVHRGDAVVAPSATRRMLDRFADQLPDDEQPPDPRLEALTDREREVLLLIAQGLSNTEIASSLFVAEPTVKTHIGRLLSKTGSRDRVQLVVLAYDAGLVRPTP